MKVAKLGIFLLSLNICTEVFADSGKLPHSGFLMDETTFEVSFSAFLPSAKTTVRVDSEQPGDGTEVILEKDLGVEDDKVLGRIELKYFFANNKSSISVSLFNLQRSGETTIEVPLNFGRTSFDSDLRLATKFEGFAYRLNYQYDFYARSNLLFGVSAGIHATDFDVSLKSLDFPELEDKASGLIPVPLIGLYTKYLISEDWLLSAEVELMDIEVDDISGNARNTFVELKYKINEKWLLTAGYNYYDIDGEARDFSRNFAGIVSYRYEGLSAGVSLRF